MTLDHGDLVSNPDMDYCEAFWAICHQSASNTIVEKDFESFPPPSAALNLYCHSQVRKSVLTSVRMELAQLPKVPTLDFDKFKEVTKYIFHYHASNPPATNKALAGYTQTKSALCLALLFMSISLISLSISFTFFRRQWKQFITHPQRFFRGTHGRFLQIVDNRVADDTQAITAFFIYPKRSFQRFPKLPKKYSHATNLRFVPLATHLQNNPLSLPMSLTRTSNLTLDHRRPPYFQC